MNKKIYIFISGIAILFLLLFGVDKFGAFDYDEAIYCAVIREMTESGNYLIPKYNNEKFYEKPILFYWLVSAVHKILSPSDVSTSGRIVSALAAAGLVFVIYYFVSALVGRGAAVLSATIFATSFATLIISKAIIMDTVFVLFLTISCFSIVASILTEKKYLILVGYASSGFAVLTKGPAGLVIPLLVGIIYYVLNRKKIKFANLKLISGIIIFCTIVLPWFVFATIKTDGEFFKDFFLVHNLQRFAVKSFEGHSGPIFYYIPVIFLALFPWSAFLSQSFCFFWKHKTDLSKFLFIWIIVIFVIFSLAKTKLPNYIIPVFPPIAVVLGVYFDKLLAGSEHLNFPGLSILLNILVAVLLIILFGGAEIIANLIKEKFVTQHPFFFNELNLGLPAKIIVAILIGGILIFYFCIRSGLIKIYVILTSLMMIIFNFVLVYSFVPKVWQIVQGGIFNLSREIKDNSSDISTIVVYDMPLNPSVSLYSHKKVIFVGRNEKEKISKIRKDAEDFWLLTKTQVFQNDLLNLKLKIFRAEGGYILGR